MTKPMNKIEKLIAELCPEGVEFKELGEIGKVSMCKRIFKNETSATGQIPFYKIGTFGKQPDAFIAEQIFKDYRKKFSFPQKGDVLLSASGTIGRRVVYDGKPAYFQDSNIIWLEHDEGKVLNKFLYHFYAIVKWQTEGGTIQRLYNDNFRKIKVPIPPLAIQQEIVKILDTFTTLAAELEAELEARKKQYEYYRDQLLTPIEVNGKWLMNNEEVEWKTLGEVCGMKAGKQISADDISSLRSEDNIYPCIGGNGTRGYVNSFSHNGKFSIIGRQGALCGNICFAEGKFYATEHAVVVEHGEHFIARFLFHLLLLMNLNQYATGGAQPGLAVSKLAKINIPIPPLAEQERIVAILDKFDALVNDISVGLPAEIAARKNQYEYYRDKLLTFQAKS